MHLNNRAFGIVYCIGLLLYGVLCFYPVLNFTHFLMCVVGLNIVWIASAYWSNSDFLQAPVKVRNFSVPTLLVLAIGFRVLPLCTDPLFEDDHYRYLWEGFVSGVGFNPYFLAPEDFFGANLSPEISAVLDGVSYPGLTSVYGGAAQVIFSFAYWLAPGETWPLKLIVLSAEVVLLCVLYSRVSPRRFVLFAFCPLLIHAMTINAHVDIIALAFVAVAFKGWDERRAIVCGLLLGLACSIKIYAVILLPLFLLPSVLTRENLRVGKNWVPGICVGVGACLSYFAVEMPFLMAGTNSVKSALTAGEGWAFNNPMYYAVHFLVGEKNTALLFMFSFMASYVWVFFRSWSVQVRALGCFTALLIFSPVVNAWYFSWVLLFAAYRGRGLWPWVAAVTLWLSYCTGVNLVGSGLALYEVPWSLMLLEWLLPLLVFLWERKVLVRPSGQSKVQGGFV